METKNMDLKKQQAITALLTDRFTCAAEDIPIILEGLMCITTDDELVKYCHGMMVVKNQDIDLFRGAMGFVIPRENLPRISTTLPLTQPTHSVPSSVPSKTTKLNPGATINHMMSKNSEDPNVPITLVRSFAEAISENKNPVVKWPGVLQALLDKGIELEPGTYPLQEVGKVLGIKNLVQASAIIIALMNEQTITEFLSNASVQAFQHGRPPKSKDAVKTKTASKSKTVAKSGPTDYLLFSNGLKTAGEFDFNLTYPAEQLPQFSANYDKYEQILFGPSLKKESAIYNLADLRKIKDANGIGQFVFNSLIWGLSSASERKRFLRHLSGEPETSSASGEFSIHEEIEA
jgi:hypothetical protein